MKDVFPVLYNLAHPGHMKISIWKNVALNLNLEICTSYFSWDIKHSFSLVLHYFLGFHNTLKNNTVKPVRSQYVRRKYLKTPKLSFFFFTLAIKLLHPFLSKVSSSSSFKHPQGCGQGRVWWYLGSSISTFVHCVHNVGYIVDSAIVDINLAKKWPLVFILTSWMILIIIVIH